MRLERMYNGRKEDGLGEEESECRQTLRGTGNLDV